MDLATLRRSRDLSQEECARQLGLKSKGYLSSLENGQERVPLWLALRLQVWSENRLLAADMRPKDRELIEAFEAAAYRRLAAAHPTEVAA